MMAQEEGIKVCIRLRPLLEREKEGGTQWSVAGNTITHKGGTSQAHYFDHVFGEESSSLDIFTTLVEPIIDSVMEGINGTIFAYGQTSSGKTHTMMGNTTEIGVIPKTISTVFDYIEEHSNREFIIRVSYFEIYNETLTDLLNPSNKLRIRESSQHALRVHGATEEPVTSVRQVAHLLFTGDSNRSVGETKMNERSSRSHTIFTMAIESRARDGEEGDGAVKISALNLVDLAGSERASASGGEGIRFKEGVNINMSLLALGNVISKLTEKHIGHVPFRDSKLTRLLQSALGGNAKTCIICTVTPAEVTETLSTLNFASRAQQVKNKPVVNEVLVGEEALRKKLQIYERENEALRRKLDERGLSDQEKHQLAEKALEAESMKSNLRARLRALEEIIVKSSADESSLTTRRGQASRRQTICPATLSRGIPAVVPLPPTFPAQPTSGQTAILPTDTPPKKRVTFAPSLPANSPFVVHFSDNSFTDHLSSLSPSSSPVLSFTERQRVDDTRKLSAKERRRARFASRLSFIPHVSTDDDYLDSDSETSQSILSQHGFTSTPCPSTTARDSLHGGVVDMEVQTDEAMRSPPPSSQPCPLFAARVPVDAATQTELEGRQTAPVPVPARPASCLESSFYCNHKCQLTGTTEALETVQFELRESEIRVQDLQESLAGTRDDVSEKARELDEAQAATAELHRKVADFNMANEAQGELLLTLQQRLQEYKSKLDSAEETNQSLRRIMDSADTVEVERAKAERAVAAEMAELREQLCTLHEKLQKPDRPAPLLTPPPTVDRQQASPTMKANALIQRDSTIQQLLAKVDQLEDLRTEDSKRFQSSYESKAQEAHRACEQVCALEEAMELLEQQLAEGKQSREYCLDLETRLSEKSVLVSELEDKSSAAEEELYTLQQEYKKLMSDTEVTLKDLQERAMLAEESAAAQVSHSQLKMVALEAELKEASKTQERCCDLEVLLTEKAVVVRELEEKCSAGEEQLQNYHNRTTALEAKLLEARQCCQEVEEQLTDQTAALRAVEQEHQMAQEQLQEQKSSAAEEELYTLQQEYKKLMSDTEVTLKDLQERAMLAEESAAAQVSHSQLKMVALEAELKEANKTRERCCDLEVLLTEKAAVVRELEEKCSAGEEQLQNYHDRATASEAQLLEARQRCQEVEERLTEQTAALRAVEQEYSMVQNQLLQYKEDLAAVRSTCEQVREQLSSAEQGRQEAWQRRCEAEGLLEERAAVFSALQEECLRAKEELQEEKEKVSAADIVVLELRSASTAVREEAKTEVLRECEQRMEELEKELQTKQQTLECEIARREKSDKNWKDEREKHLRVTGEMQWDLNENFDEIRQLKKDKVALEKQLSEVKSREDEHKEPAPVKDSVFVEREKAKHQEAEGRWQEESSRLRQDADCLRLKAEEFGEKSQKLHDQNRRLLAEVENDRKQRLCLEETVATLTAKVQALQSEMAVNPTSERRIQQLTRENQELKVKIQAEFAAVPSGTSTYANDGSGFVTGIAYHSMRSEHSALVKENERHKALLKKLKEEFQEQVARADRARDEGMRYRNERTIYRTKYEGLKKHFGINSAAEVLANCPPLSEQDASSQSEVLSSAKVPSPRPPRKSILSRRPDQSRPDDHRMLTRGQLGGASAPFQKSGSLRAEAETEEGGRREVEAGKASFQEGQAEENLYPTQKRQRFLWDQTLAEAGPKDDKTDPDQCKTQ